MEKRGMTAIVIILIVAGLIILATGLFVGYFFFSGENYDLAYEKKIADGEIVNPVVGLNDEEAVSQFNEEFIYYLMVNIKAYNLYNKLGDETPKIEVFVGEDVFNAEVDGGEIYIGNGEIEGEDIIIRTSKEEAVKMIRDKEYIESSFEEGLSSIEMVADKTELFAKGYLKIYTELTGKSFTGSAIKIFQD